MDIDTLVLIGLLVAALSWWITIHLKEEKQLIEQDNKEAKERLERAERIRRLMNK